MSLFSYLIMMFVAMFWGLRVFVTFAATSGMDFPIMPLDTNIEIVLLFVTLICMVFIIKRSLIGALVYLISYLLYFGADVYNKLNTGTLVLSDYTSIFISIVAVMVSLLTFFDIALNKNGKGSAGMNKKTSWFYGTDKFERDKDERDDRNQYKF